MDRVDVYNKHLYTKDYHSLQHSPDIQRLIKSECFGNSAGVHPYYRIYCLQQAKIDGLYMEFGVYQGNSINQMVDYLPPGKVFYGFDSFEGLPESWYDNSIYTKGCFDLKGELPQVKSNIKLIKGWFEDTLEDFLKTHEENVAFMHIDCDLYSSTKYVLTTLKDRIVPGSIIAFDEYHNCCEWEKHEYKATQEFFQETGKTYDYLAHSDRSTAAIIVTGGK